jgi:predicted site-specific integrase-resolvase
MAKWDAVKVAKCLGVAVSSVRVYVMRGLLSPISRENRKDFFDSKTVKNIGKTRNGRGRPKKSRKM